MVLEVLLLTQVCLLQGNDGLGDDVDAEAQVVLNELIMLTETEDNTDGRHQSDATEWGKTSFTSISNLWWSLPSCNNLHQQTSCCFCSCH